MHTLSFVPLSEIQRVGKIENPVDRARILADILRINVLYMIRKAGSGHIGTSFSALDIMTWLHFCHLTAEDIFFSSKGHDVPALYAILMAQEVLPFEKIHTLRKLGGLPGHPDVHTPGILTNTGSLGMGISKAHGMVSAHRLQNKTGHMYVLTGDGELQEGQIWESLSPAANARMSEITVIVDHNKIQSDIYVKDTSDLGDLEAKFAAFGWAVFRCDGNDIQAFSQTLSKALSVKDKPQVIIADTKKGSGVSFMEVMGDNGLYNFHSGAPSIENYTKAFDELSARVQNTLAQAKLSPLSFETSEIEIKPASPHILKINGAYGDELVKVAQERKDIVALDADLVLDTGLIPFKKTIPERYMECGIAEQDMVSIAGGLALRGMLPIVHSFACFLSTRPNEQIYNNATEYTKIIYTSSLAGLLPATPGHSHQSVRDISAIGSMPGITMFEPSNEQEIRMALRWAVFENKESTYFRICNAPIEPSYTLPDNYSIKKGVGVELASGTDIAIIAYGPVMLEQAMKARAILAEKNISVRVINLPWLNVVDNAWLTSVTSDTKLVVTIDDHYTTLGQGVTVAASLATLSSHPPVLSLGLTAVPESGQLMEILEHHKLDSMSLAHTIEQKYQTLTKG